MLKEKYKHSKVVKPIFNNENSGFSKANNIGLKQAKGKYILLLNSDTCVLENCIDKCIDYIENDKNIGALGCKLVLGDGTLDHACKRGFPSPSASFYYMLKLDKLFPDIKKYGQYRMSYLGNDEIGEVDSLTGAFMLIRRHVIDEIGLLDEEFFMYGEDLDWCYRIKEAGYKIIYYPEVKTIHYKGQSSKKKRWKTLYEFHRAMWLFYNKHYKRKYNFLVTLFVYIGVILRLLCVSVVNMFKK
jgi:GT2 family glycosyltransferase